MQAEAPGHPVQPQPEEQPSQLELVIVCGGGALAGVEDVQDGEHGADLHVRQDDDGVSAILRLCGLDKLLQEGGLAAKDGAVHPDLINITSYFIRQGVCHYLPVQGPRRARGRGARC